MLRTIRNATLAATLLAAPAAIAFAATGTGSAGTLGAATGTTPSMNGAAGVPPYAAAPTTNPDTQLGTNSPLNTNPGANSNLNGMAAGSAATGAVGRPNKR
jgi:hypothetical protein